MVYFLYRKLFLIIIPVDYLMKIE